MEFLVTNGGITPGVYPAEFLGIEPFTPEVDLGYPPAIRLRFRILGGPEAGLETSRVCSRKMTPRSTLFKFASAMKGGPLLPGQPFSFDPFVGMKGNLVVELNENNNARITSFIPSRTEEKRVEALF